jgi:hypothetical protein
MKRFEQRHEHDAGVDEAGLQDGVEVDVGQAQAPAEHLGVADSDVERGDRRAGGLAEVLGERFERVIGEDGLFGGVEAQALAERRRRCRRLSARP